MRIDRTHRAWAIGFLAALVLSGAGYIFYSASSPEGPRGGSPIGLTFGVVGFALMLFAALLGARKRVPVWRLGRAKSWMRGHLWLGTLSLPLIFFHGGFHFGGLLTSVLLWLLIFTVLSGIFGATLQHYLPRVMTTDVPLETIYAEIENVKRLLREEADRTIEALCGPLNLDAKTMEGGAQRAGGFTALRPLSHAASGVATEAVTEILLLGDQESAPLRKFYFGEMRPFLERPDRRDLPLRDADQTRSKFSALRTLLPVTAHATLEDLEGICEEARQLSRQEQLHRWLHGWLLLHIPLSLALIALSAIHAAMALRYS